METWIEYSGVKVAVTPENGPCEVVEKSAGGYVLKVGDDHYGVWEDGRSYVVIPKTRWGSAHKDGEWIEVDLGDVYTVNRVVLVWENARATDYDIEVSADGEKWTTAASVRGGKGGTEKVDL